MATEGSTLKVWRLHPGGCPIVPAEKTLRDTANRGAVRWCGPFTNANRSGWWVFPPVDMDVIWRGGKEFDARVLTPYADTDAHLIRFLLDDSDDAHPERWLPDEGRTKFSWGLVEDGVVQIWTGCIFETPPGWGLHVRSPVNVPPRACHVMEAVLETDWLQYDVWLNVAFDRKDELVELRRDGWPPLAQLVPVPRESYDAPWLLDEETINRNSDDANRVFEFFVSYNERKFAGEGRHPLSTSDPSVLKDSSTYHKERKRVLSDPYPPVRPSRLRCRTRRSGITRTEPTAG